MAMNSLNRFADPVYCIMRLIVGLNFASHGGQLLFGVHAVRCSHLERHDGGGLFHGPRATQLLPNCEQGRTRRLLLLVFLVRRLLRPRPLEHRRNFLPKIDSDNTFNDVAKTKDRTSSFK